MTLKTKFKEDGRKTVAGRINALIKQLQGSWSGLDIEEIVRTGTGNEDGWQVTFHDPPRTA